MHISDENLTGLKQGLLSGEEEQEALLHISECADCAGRFAEIFESGDREPPAGFSERVREGIKDKKREFLLYSARVMVSVAASLAIVFTQAFPEYFAKTEQWWKNAAEKTISLKEKINFNGGVFVYENQEK